MMDPERLLANGGTDFERTVLRAAKLEQPSSVQRRRMRRALLLAEFGFLTAGFKAAASVSSQLVVVAVVAGVLAGSGTSSRTEPFRNVEKVVTPVKKPIQSPSDWGQAPAVTAKPEDAVRVEDLPLYTDDGTDAKAAPRPTNNVKTVDLSEEIRLLDEARVALRARAPGRALSTIQRYLSRFPRGSFRQEATVLRIEALAMNGNQAQAASEAKRFVITHPKSPQVDKLQRITGNVTPATKP